MRIIAGEFRSRRLLTPKDDSVTRPMPDRVKESLFGLLRGHCEGASVFDGFAGTGSIGLEAVSRGAERCVFIERDKGAAELLRGNIGALGVQDRCDLVVGDALGAGALSRCPRPVTLVFLDPPYPLIRDPIGWKRVRAQFEKLIDLLTDDGIAVLRTPWPFSLETGGEPVAESLPTRRHRPRREKEDWARPGRRGREVEGETGSPEAEDAGGAATKPEVEVVPADLTFPNAQGPETHVYHSTALHLYMRKKRERGTDGSSPPAA